MSSCIASASYDPETKVLVCQFVKGGGHTYKDVPPEIGIPFAENPSGAVFNRTIRPNYS